jgi:hypothetical protein
LFEHDCLFAICNCLRGKKLHIFWTFFQQERSLTDISPICNNHWSLPQGYDPPHYAEALSLL